jgi:hypothetical protein
MVPGLIDTQQGPANALFWATRWCRSIDPPRIPAEELNMEYESRVSQAVKTVEASRARKVVELKQKPTKL